MNTNTPWICIKNRKSNTIFSFASVIVIAALMCFSAIYYDIAPASLVTFSNDRTGVDFDTAQKMARSICAQDENTALILSGGRVCADSRAHGHRAWGNEQRPRVPKPVMEILYRHVRGRLRHHRALQPLYLRRFWRIRFSGRYRDVER